MRSIFSLLLFAIALPAAAAVTINNGVATATITPGADAFFFFAGRDVAGSPGVSTPNDGGGLVHDTSGTGAVSFNMHTNAKALLFVWVVDLSTGQLQKASSLSEGAAPADVSLDGPFGQVISVPADANDQKTFGLVRRGVGGWSGHIRESSINDADGVANGRVAIAPSQFTPLGGAAAAPENFQPGDFIFFFNFDQNAAFDTTWNPAPAPATDGAPRLFTWCDRTARAEGMPITIAIARLGDPAGTVSVNYDTRGGSDSYAAASGTLTFAPGDTRKDITVQTFADHAYDGLVSVRLYLTASGATVVSPIDAIFIDDTQPPVVSIADVTVKKGTGIATAPMAITLAGPTRIAATISWGGPTGAGDLVQFNPGETTKTILVPYPAAGPTPGSPEYYVTLYRPNWCTPGRVLARIHVLDVQSSHHRAASH